MGDFKNYGGGVTGQDFSDGNGLRLYGIITPDGYETLLSMGGCLASRSLGLLPQKTGTGTVHFSDLPSPEVDGPAIQMAFIDDAPTNGWGDLITTGGGSHKVLLVYTGSGTWRVFAMLN